MKHRNYIQITVALLLVAASGLSVGAQTACTRMGLVATPGTDCGAVILDLQTGEAFWAIQGLGGHSVGQKVLFDAEPAMLPAGCTPNGIPAVAITCIADLPVCESAFTVREDAINNLTRHFEALTTDAEGHHCTWTFGDGTTANGLLADHTYPYEGLYAVCLTIWDQYGCYDQRCDTINVSAQNATWCAYEMSLTAVGNKLHGSLAPMSGDAGNLESVRWFLTQNNQTLSNDKEFTYALAPNDNYLVCVDYQVKNPDDGSLCEGKRCQQIILDTANCVQPALADPDSVCAGVYAPVCGCDGLTYANECEALRAGVLTWWAGECGSATQGTCGADMHYNVVDGDPDTGFKVVFHNRSNGFYNFCHLDFGDGSPIFEQTNWDTVVHWYAKAGIYRATLSTWQFNACLSSLTQLVVTDAYQLNNGQKPASTDYVLPGDTNGDGKANVLDLLHIGLSYFHNGPPRPHAHTAWSPQYAPNWPSHANSVNDKHADADGDGVVNEFDASAIPMHYQALEFLAPVAGGTAPKLRIVFPVDTLDIDPNNPTSLDITADVVLGSAQEYVKDFYGLAFSLHYPEFIQYPPNANYYSNSFFGFNTYTMWLPYAMHDQMTMDMGLVRKDKTGVNGYGKLAQLDFQLDFIIIVDVGDRTDSRVVPMTVPVDGIRAIDANGDALALNVPIELDTLWLRFNKSVGTGSPQNNNEAFKVFPNPALDQATIFTGNLNIEHLEVLNALGQTMHRQNGATGSATKLDVNTWPTGLYTVRVRTKDGLSEQIFMKH
ncbi:MAG: PKD domain-containing protein [Saprospiraceae bacterium]